MTTDPRLSKTIFRVPVVRDGRVHFGPGVLFVLDIVVGG